MDGSIVSPEHAELSMTSVDSDVDLKAARTPPVKPVYPPPTPKLTQLATHDIRFDFNLSARILLPGRTSDQWRVQLRDLDSGNIFFESENRGAFVSPSKRYFVRLRPEVWDVDAGGIATPVLSHTFDASDRAVLIQFPVGTLGDILAWFPCAARFAAAHGCHLICAMSALIMPLLRDSHPSIHCVTHEEIAEQKIKTTVCATYCSGLFLDDTENIWQPTDFRCWNDPKEGFDHKDYLWCPRDAGSGRQFECTRLITTSHVIATIKQITGFGFLPKKPRRAS